MFQQKREAVSLNHYGSTTDSRIDRYEDHEECNTIGSLATKATAITKHVESHENSGFDHSQGQDKSDEKRREFREVSVDKPPGKSSEKSKERRVRFDLRGSKERKARRPAMGNIPDIIVISEEAGGNLKYDETDKKRAYGEEASDDDDELPADISSIFEDARKSSATLPSVSDEEGTVVEI